MPSTGAHRHGRPPSLAHARQSTPTGNVEALMLVCKLLEYARTGVLLQERWGALRQGSLELRRAAARQLELAKRTSCLLLARALALDYCGLGVILEAGKQACQEDTACHILGDGETATRVVRLVPRRPDSSGAQSKSDLWKLSRNPASGAIATCLPSYAVTTAPVPRCSPALSGLVREGYSDRDDVRKQDRRLRWSLPAKDSSPLQASYTSGCHVNMCQQAASHNCPWQ